MPLVCSMLWASPFILPSLFVPIRISFGFQGLCLAKVWLLMHPPFLSLWCTLWTFWTSVLAKITYLCFWIKASPQASLLHVISSELLYYKFLITMVSMECIWLTYLLIWSSKFFDLENKIGCDWKIIGVFSGGYHHTAITEKEYNNLVRRKGV